VKHTVEVVSDGMIHIPNFMKISWNIQVILRLLPQQFEGQRYWYYGRERSMNYTVEMTSGGMRYMLVFMTIGSGIQVILRLLPQ
jgi:hypothetical protein